MKKDIHLATSVEALNNLAQKSINVINSEKIKPDKLYNSAETLFKYGLEDLHNGDEERAYILFVRFILIYETLNKISDKRIYTKQRLGKEHNTVSDQLKRLESSLTDRYNNVKKEEISPIVESPKDETNSSPSTMVFSFGSNIATGYINCSELYDIMQTKINIVILDTRPRDNYLHSSMKYLGCVNIPEEIIQFGASANTLGKLVPNESRSQWDKRWEASMTVLLDWSSTKETMTASKLSILRDILMNWDVSMSDNYPLVILNGGYLEWLQMYPMLCTNPDVVYEVQNNVLNDLLDLDSIEYPSAEETVSARFIKPPSIQPVVNRATKPVVGDKTKSNLPPNETNAADLLAQRNQETEENLRFELLQKEKKFLEDKAAFEKSKEELNKENEELREKLQNISNNKANKISDKENTDIRARLLQEAREKKKNFVLSDVNIYNLTKCKLLEFENKMKPLGKKSVEPGLTGLVNLGCTCYLNSVVQCFSHTRVLHNFFILSLLPNLKPYTGRYGEVSQEFKILMERLWAGRNKAFSPGKFKAIVDRHGPRYKGREQQDAHEYLISLSNWLHDELKQDIERPIQVVWTPRQRNWITSTDGKTSIMIDTFSGQLVNIITCEECHKKRERLEVFENLSLALPPQGSCTLEKCLEKYFSKQQIEDYTCNKCQTNKLINVEIQIVHHPTVLVLCLKRFTESIKNGEYTFIKNIVSVIYPLRNLNLFGMVYHLYGVIVHKTTTLTLTSGHYYALCKNIRNGRWYKYDDQYVSEINIEDVLEPMDAYILFYQRDTEEKICIKQYREEKL